MQKLQKLGLASRRELRDFVQKQSATLRASHFPSSLRVAPVYAPGNAPKNSLSINVSGMAEQLISTKGQSRRGLLV
jgi:hypothetical protein